MPELPEIALYLHALEPRVVGQPIEAVRLASPALLKTFDPPLSAVNGKRVLELERLGKRIVFVLEDDLFVVVHLMISGRFKWKPKGTAVPRKLGQAAFDFPTGTLLLTEASTQKRASLHVLRGREALEAMRRGGVEPLEDGYDAFRDALMSENRTLKRALTDPDTISGVGNAHSDEILWLARISPGKRTQQLDDAEMRALYDATVSSLREWADRLIEETGDRFPEKVTAFHPAMAVHGRFKEPCPRCGAPIQRIVYAGHETNYCAKCQTGGRLLADRAFSRLLGADWPRRLEE